MSTDLTSSSPEAMALVDFGSTFTKVAIVGTAGGALIASGQSTTTVATDVLDGLAHAFADCEPGYAAASAVVRRCCSSAGGGLRMVVVGLEADITTQAANQVALNAGGRIAATLSGVLSASEVDDLVRLDPDLILLSGGTDGGNTDCLINNARSIAARKPASVIVLAGNADAKDDAGRYLEDAGCTWLSAPNVLPQIGIVDTERVQAAIREVFISHVIGGKNLSKSADFTKMVSLPTPDAVRQGVELLSVGTGQRPGLGGLVVVDVGGATTDVYSVIRTSHVGAQRKELVPSAQTSRTVEADLGLRWSAEGVVEAARSLNMVTGLKLERLVAAAQVRISDPSFLPQTDDERADDIELARLAAVIAVRRHAGRTRVGIGPEGVSIRLEGRDLREVPLIIVTGGVFRANPTVDFAEMFNEGFASFDRNILGPKQVRVVVDKRYVLAAAGLLSPSHPDAAFHLMYDQIINLSREGAQQ